MNILVLNPGSATLKFRLYQMPELNKASTTTDSATVLASGIVEPIGATQSELKMFVAAQKPTIEPVEATTPVQAAEQIIRRLLAYFSENTQTPTAIDAVGCRVVHGGPRLVKPTRVTASVLHELRALKELAPLHIPADVAILEKVQQSLPETPVIAVFDTAFHQTLPPVAYTYALPVELSAQYKLRRYGFHGISHAYVSEQLIERLGRGAKGTKIITCHLGSGASVCAVHDGQSIDTSMGLTPMEGLVMGTRSGDVDPGLVLYLIRTAGMSANEVDSLLNNQSGLRGLSGQSADVRDLEQAKHAGDKRAEVALQVFAYRARKYIGADNASCESFMKTLKREEIYANDYVDLEHLRMNIVAFIEQYYNRCRLHSALGYRSPEEFEQAVESAPTSAGATMSFFRHGEDYRPDGGHALRSTDSITRSGPQTAPPTIGFDESPAGYSLASCSPAELASASPAADDSE